MTVNSNGVFEGVGGLMETRELAEYPIPEVPTFPRLCTHDRKLLVESQYACTQEEAKNIGFGDNDKAEYLYYKTAHVCPDCGSILVVIKEGDVIHPMTFKLPYQRYVDMTLQGVKLKDMARDMADKWKEENAEEYERLQQSSETRYVDVN